MTPPCLEDAGFLGGSDERDMTKAALKQLNPCGGFGGGVFCCSCVLVYLEEAAFCGEPLLLVVMSGGCRFVVVLMNVMMLPY